MANTESNLFFQEYDWALKKDFWTSGTSKGCAGTFEWCSKGEKLDLKESRWIMGRPQPEESCVFANLLESTSGNSSFGTALCTEKKQFICEVSYL